MSNYNITIIPEPKKIQYSNTAFKLGDCLVCTCMHNGSKVLAEVIDICKNLESLGSEVEIKFSSADQSADSIYSLNAVIFHYSGQRQFDFQGHLDELSTDGLPEGYILDISERHIILLARDDAGLFYACQTFLQLIHQLSSTQVIPGITIEDYPSFSIRGTQIDMSELAPTRETIEERLRLFAHYKINTVLMTYWDKFPFDRHSQIRHADALSKNDIRKIVQLASSLHIDLIPCIQSLGHSENVLAYDEYASLREDKHILTQFCPENPETFTIFQDMAEEVMSLHNSKYFHIGADEAYFLGHCPACKTFAETQGPIGVYMRYISKICTYLRKRGKIPLIWDDILSRSPKHLSQLDQCIMLYYWDYMPADNPNPFVFFRNDGWYCNKNYWRNKIWWGGDFQRSPRCKEIEHLSPELMQAYGPYLSDEKDFCNFKPYPFYRYYCDTGFKTVACCAVRGGEYGYILPNYRKRFSNIQQMAKLVEAQSGIGLLSTSWSEMQSPDELTIYPLMFTAECAWSPHNVQIEKFNEKFVQQCFGCNDCRIVQAMNDLAQHVPPLLYVIEERSDYQTHGVFADNETYPALFESRWANYWNNVDSDEILEKLRKELEEVRRAYLMLKACRLKIKRGRNIFCHLLLAGRMSVHKFEQAVLLRQAEDKLNLPETLTIEDVGLFLQSLMSFRDEMMQLQMENERLFSLTYLPDGVQRRSRQIFEGELKFIDEQIHRFQSIIESNACIVSDI